jgi:uncharacterized membrane protein
VGRGVNAYLWLKFGHILIAVIALGTSAGLGIVMEFYGDHPTHGAFVLRAVRRLLYFVVAPGYVLMLVTGFRLASLASLLDAHWVERGMQLWGVGALLIGLSLVVMHKQIRLMEAGGPSSYGYRIASMLGRLFGGGTGLVVVVILYFMVLKPA